MATLPSCPFGHADGDVLANARAHARYGIWPDTRGYLLIVPRRQDADRIDLTAHERQAIITLTEEAGMRIIHRPAIDGCNLGDHGGCVARHTQSHTDFHLMPRGRGDVEKPRGAKRAATTVRQQD